MHLGRCCQCITPSSSSFSGSTTTCAHCTVAPLRFQVTVPSFGSGGPCPSAYIGAFTLHHDSACQWVSTEVPICTGHVPDGLGGTIAACFNYGSAARFTLTITLVSGNINYSLTMDSYMHTWPDPYPSVKRNWCRVIYGGTFGTGTCVSSRSLSKSSVSNTVITSGVACGTSNSSLEWAWGVGSASSVFPASVSLVPA